MLIEQTEAAGRALGAPSRDIGPSVIFETRCARPPTDRLRVESVANHSEDPRAGATIALDAPKRNVDSGCPACVLALIHIDHAHPAEPGARRQQGASHGDRAGADG